MYLKRKIDCLLDEWLTNENKKPALIIGIRQCGKTESVKNLAKRHKLQLITINFWLHPEYASLFNESLDTDTIISKISLLFPKINIKPNNSIIFFDEIQECSRARLSFKFFKEDGRYNVIGSGSYLGINGYIINDSTPAPTGAEDVFNMKTMDFEEFLWANGYGYNQIDYLFDHFNNRKPIDEGVHTTFKRLFLTYACTSGFPEAISTYLSKHQLGVSFRVLQNIVFDMRSDFGRRKDSSGNPIFKQSEVARIINAFDLIPSFLAKDNKRFVVSKISGGLQSKKNDAIEYLRQAHIVEKVYNLEIPSIPLKGEIIPSCFKLFPCDIGLVIALYGSDILYSIINGNLGQGKGALYEAIVFDSLYKANVDTYYYSKNSGLEVDFVISYNGYPTLIETKAKNGNAKSSKTIMKHPEHYGRVKLIKIGDYNIAEEGDILTIPHYLTFLLGHSKLIN